MVTVCAGMAWNVVGAIVTVCVGSICWTAGAAPTVVTKGAAADTACTVVGAPMVKVEVIGIVAIAIGVVQG